MKYKALFLDLDGTTLPAFQNTVSPKVIEMIKKGKERVFISIATGRLLKDVTPILTQLQLNGLCVIDNGAQIYDPKTKKFVKQIELERNSIPHVMQILDTYPCDVYVFNGEKEEKRKDWKNIPTIVSLYIPDIAPKIIDVLHDRLNKISNIAMHRLLGSNPSIQSLEITHAEATKQYGIFEVAKLEKISTHEIIGVGDGYNDFPLLMASGLKIAMGNAVPELKAIADFVVPSVDEDGVATVIEKFILEQ